MTKLKQLRLNKNLTQAELARETKLNLRTLQYYEQGSKPIESARLDKLMKLCLVLQCKISDIIDDPASIQLCNKYEKGVE